MAKSNKLTVETKQDEKEMTSDSPDANSSPPPSPPPDAIQQSFTDPRRKRKVIVIGVLVFVLLVTVITLILVLVVFKPKQPMGYEETTNDLLAALRGDRSYIGGLHDDTPQAKALDWLKTKDTGSKVDVTPPHVMIERYAMAVFFFATNGNSWQEKAEFLSQKSICEWWNSKDEYLLCHQSDLVTDVNFFNNSLGGTLPTEIGLLRNLFWFHLPANNIAGTIPSEIGEMSTLTSLVLASNKLTGQIPASIGQLTEVRTLELENNQLSGRIPPEIGQLTNTQTLYLGKNQISGPIPSEIGKLVNASDLFLQSNEFTGSIPPTIGDMTNLQFVFLQDNPTLTGSLEPLCQAVESSNAVFRAEADCRDNLVECTCCEGC